MRIEEDLKLDFKDVLIRPKRSRLASRSEVNITRKFIFPYGKYTFEGVPIIAANMDGVGTMSMAKILAKQKIMTALTKHYPEDKLVEFFANVNMQKHVFYSLGTSAEDFRKFSAVYEKTDKKIRFVCIDVANGYSQAFLHFVRKFREKFSDVVLMAGNVVSNEMAEALILEGVDIVKVGIGPGSTCTTRKMTGVGMPQLSAIIDCADAAHGLGGMICADGGCTVPGDVSKAFGANADFVMLGGMLAGHQESEMELEEHEGQIKIKFYGMSSKEAMDKHAGGVANYRASEGKVVRLEYRGIVANTLQEILGGIRSTCTYVGAAHLKELPKRTTFIRVSQQINNVFGSS